MKSIIFTTELFQAMIIKKILQLKLTNNIRQAKEKIKRGKKKFVTNLIDKTIKHMRKIKSK